MSVLEFQNWPNGRVKSCLAGDVVSLTPLDPATTSLLTYAVTTAPGGSTASFASGLISPDVDGYYLFTVTASPSTALRSLYRFSAAVLASPQIANLRNSSAARSDAAIRRLLENIANAIGPSALPTFNTTLVLPAGVNLYALGAE
jgi:hypothetical protein